MHGLEKIAPKPGSHALLIGAGPTGLMMAQFLYVEMILLGWVTLSLLYVTENTAVSLDSPSPLPELSLIHI